METHRDRRSQTTYSSAAFRAFGGADRAADGQCHGACYESQAAGGVQESAREPAQLQAG